MYKYYNNVFLILEMFETVIVIHMYRHPQLLKCSSLCDRHSKGKKSTVINPYTCVRA